ncbi:hypothetical protein LEN26_011817 [Aphanomyces euteiches]|nr:hypothetical protein LEN26_011817 [Aphanomyces euteiches]KAH9122497.1 hypothetical protein AeMF1_006229 [Aphanomyces euteiches]KAH9181826.1 hypothetical protein AeNC1_016199 [Aphanomyces euteiches]
MGREGKRTKAKQAKSKREASSKKKVGRGSSGSGVDVNVLRRQLDKLGCQLVTIDSDGNCLFRALSDQIYGDQSHFAEIRAVTSFATLVLESFQAQRIVEYIKHTKKSLNHLWKMRKSLITYVRSTAIDLICFQYCNRMMEDGVWGGNLELYVATQVWQHNIVVHQVDGNRTTIDCGENDADSFHICYYNDEHYDSVRSANDDLTGAPMPIELKDIESSKICVDTSQDANQESDPLLMMLSDFSHVPEDELVALWEQFNCDPNRVRQKLLSTKSKHALKKKKS